MEMVCLSTFGQFGRIKGLSFHKVYKVKFYYLDKLLITNDFGKPQMVDSNNFVSWDYLKNFSQYTD